MADADIQATGLQIAEEQSTQDGGPKAPSAQEPSAKGPNAKERYPLLVRIYGVLSIVAGGLQVLAIALLVFGLASGFEVELRGTGHHTATTVVVAIVLAAVSVALAVLFFVLGIRLLRGKRHRVALMCNVMIALEVVHLVCQLMLTGIGAELIAPGVNLAILIALQSYSDPSLVEERQLQRKLRKMEDRTAAEEGMLGLDTTGRGYIKLNFFNVFWIFVIACIAGLLIEIVWHMTMVDPCVYQDRAGLLYGPFSPIYGVGAVLMTVALNRFHDKSALAIFLVAAVIGGAFEFFVSWFMETAFGIVAWDYTGTFLNIDGRTNFMFMCMWGGLGLIWVKFAMPFLLKVVNLIPWNWRYAVTTVCAVLMLADCVLTLASFDCWYQREAGTMDYDDPSAIVQFCNEHYGGDFMANRFQSMTMDPTTASRAS